MKRSSKSSGSKSRSRAKEDFALRAVFNAMFAIGISVRSADDADHAIDLAAKLMTYALRREVSSDEIKARMAQLIEEGMLDEVEASTKH